MVNMPSLTVIEDSVGARIAPLLLGAGLEQELHLRGGGAPEGPARLVVLGLDLLAELVHRRVLLLLGRALGHRAQRAGPDAGGRAGGAVGALHPAADLVPVLVEEHHHRDGLVPVVEEGVAQVRHLVAEEHPQLGTGYRLADVGDQRRVAMHVAAPVLGEHHHVLDPGRPGEELLLLVGELGVGVVLLGAGPGVAHLGHVVLPGQPGGKALRVEGNRQLSHVVLASVRVMGLGRCRLLRFRAVYCKSLALIGLLLLPFTAFLIVASPSASAPPASAAAPPSIATSNMTSEPSRRGVSRSASSPSTAAVRSVVPSRPRASSRPPRLAPAARTWRWGPSPMPGRRRRRAADRVTDTATVGAPVRDAS